MSELKKKLKFWNGLTSGLGFVVMVPLLTGLRDMVYTFDQMGLVGGSDPASFAADISAAIRWVLISAAAIPFLIFAMVRRYQLKRTIRAMN